MKGTNHVIHETQIIHLEPPGTINNNIEEGDVVLQNPISLEESMTGNKPTVSVVYINPLY